MSLTPAADSYVWKDVFMPVLPVGLWCQLFCVGHLHSPVLSELYVFMLARVSIPCGFPLICESSEVKLFEMGTPHLKIHVSRFSSLSEVGK